MSNCKEVKLVRVYFPGILDTHIVYSVGGGNYSDKSITVCDLVNSNPQFYFEKNTDGQDILCTVKTTENPLVGSFAATGGALPVDTFAISIPVNEFVGGRPDDAIRK